MCICPHCLPWHEKTQYFANFEDPQSNSQHLSYPCIISEKIGQSQMGREKRFADAVTQPIQLTGKEERPKEVRRLTQTARAVNIRSETRTQVSYPTALSVACQASSENHLTSFCHWLLCLLPAEGTSRGCAPCLTELFIPQGLPQTFPAY